MFSKIFRRRFHRPFDEQATQFAAFLEEALATGFPPARPGKPCAVVVMSMVETAVPWFSIALALLCRKNGQPVTLVYHDLPFPSRNEPPYQLEVINRLLKKLRRHFEIIRVSTLPEKKDGGMTGQALDELAGMNAETYLQRVAQGLPDEEVRAACRQALAQAASRLGALFDARFDHWVVPSGLYGYSGVYRMLGKQSGERVACYDSGTGTLILGTDDVAGHCMDLAKVFSPRFAPLLAEHGETMVWLAKGELAKRLLASDRYSYQKSAANPADMALGMDVLIPLSIFDDAAGIGKTQSFVNGEEWLGETVGWLLEKTNFSVVIREHPVTRKVKTNRDIQLRIADRHKDHPRFRFIAGTDEVSTYALLKRAKVVLPCASTVGVEAAALGKHVVMESSAYYARMGFARFVQSKQEYFEEISRALESSTPLPEEHRSQAWICYFLGQVANFIDGEFTPIPSDAAKWMRRPFAELAADEKVRMIIEVLAENTPSCLVQGRHLLQTGKYDLNEARELAGRMEQFFTQTETQKIPYDSIAK